MKVTNICKAESIEKIELEDQTIRIDGKIPKGMTFRMCEEFYGKQACLLDAVLSETLPQGTYARLRIMFMQKKLSPYQRRIE